ncbi:MAG TPA: glycosyltransferase family 4 protein [Candidatus Woesebacteria bacterium]|nr:glycosyltransferase family 4 protein [Candidatus Woesebacteria bacterium]
MNSKDKINFFICPASDYLNQYNETGSHGQISYQFLKHLAQKEIIAKIYAVVIMSVKVDVIKNTTIDVLVKKKGKSSSLSAFDSLFFYIYSYIKYFRSKDYHSSDVVHHIIPFYFGRSFNLFFLFKNSRKKYIIGPIIGPHSNGLVIADESYISKESKSTFYLRILGILRTTGISLFTPFLYYLSKRTFQNADIIFCSDKNSLTYHKKYLKKNQKIYILDTGVDTNVFKPEKTNQLKKGSSDNLEILFVGRLTKRKGCEYLIRAIAYAINKKRGLKVHCKILGTGHLREELERLVDDLKIKNYIEFLGGVESNEDIVHQYRKTDIVCLPALSETFTVTKEALCSGKPVIVTDVCSNAERVEDGINGFVVPPMDYKAIAKIILDVSINKKILYELSENAVKARSLYDWSNIADEYLSHVSTQMK